jgi:cytochrome c peroxidase
MTLMHHRGRLALALVALAAIAVLVVKLAGGSSGDAAIATAATDPHAKANVPAAQLRRVLAATESASQSASQAELISQGRALFESSSLAKAGESCGGCHTLGTANISVGLTPHLAADGKTVLFGRDPPSLVGARRTAPYGWTAATPTLRQMVVNTILGHFKDGATQSADTTAQQAAALEAYVASIKPPTTSFDQGTMSAAAIRGEDLFQGKGACIACHGGPLFTDNGLHNTLVPQRDGWNDPGATTPPGAFNTPTLRDLRNTAPYMHNGVFATLKDVVEFYNARSSIAPLNLTPQEIDDLVAYLDSL